MRWDRLPTCCAVVLCLLIAPAAFADFTPILPPHPGEDSHQQILSTVYGGTFLPVGSVDFSNGTLLAKRVHDFFPGDEDGDGGLFMGPTGGIDETDQTWRAHFTHAAVEAKFAAFEQNFGFFDGASGGTYQQLFQVTGDDYDVQGEAIIPLLADRTLRWGRGGQGRILSSRIADNPDQRDHMVTYQILEMGPDGGVPLFRWMVFWEDIMAGEPFEDWDFQDLVVEIRAIPEPVSALGLGLLALLGLARRR